MLTGATRREYRWLDPEGPTGVVKLRFIPYEWHEYLMSVFLPTMDEGVPSQLHLCSRGTCWAFGEQGGLFLVSWSACINALGFQTLPITIDLYIDLL